MATSEQNAIDQQLNEARRIVAGLVLPPEVKSLSVSLGSDSMGESALWLHLYVAPEVDASKDEVKRLTEFARTVQSRLFDGGITLFPYTSLEQAA